MGVTQALRSAWRRTGGRLRYRSQAAAEQAFFAGCVDVHALPAIFHYWSNRYLRPMLEAYGFSHPDAFFAKYASACLAANGGGGRIASLGSGNGDMEVRLAKALRAAGHDDFTIDCLEINREMLVRGDALARAEGVERHIVGRRIDVNREPLDGRYDAVLANRAAPHRRPRARVRPCRRRWPTVGSSSPI